MNDSSRKMKILHVAECIGGVDKYLHSLIKYMNHDKFDNVVILSQLYKKEDYIGLADYVEQIEIAHGMGTKTLSSAKTLRKLIKKHSPDLCHPC